MQIIEHILVFSIVQEANTQIIDLKHVCLFVLNSGVTLESYILLLVSLYAKRDNLLIKMPGGHADPLAQITFMQIILQGHV